MSLTIYHNPRCSKSRQTLKLIEEAGAEVDIVLYLDTPPSAAQISDLLSKLGFASAQQLMRCLLYTSPSPRDQRGSRMPSSA